MKEPVSLVLKLHEFSAFLSKFLFSLINLTLKEDGRCADPVYLFFYRIITRRRHEGMSSNN